MPNQLQNTASRTPVSPTGVTYQACGVTPFVTPRKGVGNPRNGVDYSILFEIPYILRKKTRINNAWNCDVTAGILNIDDQILVIFYYLGNYDQGNRTTGTSARKNAHFNQACYIFSDTLLVYE